MTGGNFRYRVLQVAQRMIKYATLSRLGSKFGYGFVAGPPADGSLGQEDAQQPVRFMQWFGFRSRPVVKQGESIVVAPRGGTSNAVAICADNLAHGPTDLAEGESVMFSSGGSTIRQDTAGKVTVDAKAPSDVVVNGGTRKVARVQDEVGSGVLTSQVVTVGMVKTVTLIYTDPDGAVVPLLTLVFTAGALTAATPPGPTPATIRGRITSGADRFKA